MCSSDLSTTSMTYFGAAEATHVATGSARMRRGTNGADAMTFAIFGETRALQNGSAPRSRVWYMLIRTAFVCFFYYVYASPSELGPSAKLYWLYLAVLPDAAQWVLVFSCLPAARLLVFFQMTLVAMIVLYWFASSQGVWFFVFFPLWAFVAEGVNVARISRKVAQP